MRLRIVLITRTLVPDGGVSIHVNRSAAALVRAGHEVTCFAASGPPPKGVRYVEFPELIAGAPSKEARAQIGDALSEVRSDVIHFHQVEQAELQAMCARHAPTVTSVHGYLGCAPNTRYFRPGDECWRPHGPGCVVNMLVRNCNHQLDPRPIPGQYRAAAERVEVLRSSSAVVSYSGAVDRHVAVNRIERRHVVPLFHEIAPPSAYRPGGPVLFSGRIVAAKGLDLLVRAMTEVDRKAVVFGDGWQKPEVEDLARDLGILERIDFRGWGSGAQLEDADAEAALVVVPSRWPEPFGMVGLEAMAHGRPVIAADTGGIPDWLQNGETGLLFRAGDHHDLALKLSDLLAQPEVAARMGAAGRKRLGAEFSVERHVQALESLYSSLVSGPRN